MEYTEKLTDKQIQINSKKEEQHICDRFQCPVKELSTEGNITRSQQI